MFTNTGFEEFTRSSLICKNMLLSTPPVFQPSGKKGVCQHHQFVFEKEFFSCYKTPVRPPVGISWWGSPSLQKSRTLDLEKGFSLNFGEEKCFFQFYSELSGGGNNVTIQGPAPKVQDPAPKVQWYSTQGPRCSTQGPGSSRSLSNVQHSRRKP